jgi:DDE family transposase
MHINKLTSVYEKVMLHKRALIETIIDQLKNMAQIEHSRHRCFTNFVSNLFAALCAYSFTHKKPSLNQISNSILKINYSFLCNIGSQFIELTLI